MRMICLKQKFDEGRKIEIAKNLLKADVYQFSSWIHSAIAAKSTRQPESYTNFWICHKFYQSLLL